MTAVDRPEDTYKTTTDRTERRKLRTQVVNKYRTQANAIAHRLVPREHWEEAEQVAALGLIVALETYDPENPRYRSDFIGFAFFPIRKEITKWADRALRWRPRNDNKARAKREFQTSMVVTGSSDEFTAESPTTEEIVSEAELARRLRAFCESLSDEDRRIFLSENPAGLRSRQSSRHCSLVERARAFVQGSPDEWTSKSSTRPSRPATA